MGWRRNSLDRSHGCMYSGIRHLRLALERLPLESSTDFRHRSESRSLVLDNKRLMMGSTFPDDSSGPH